MLLEIQIQSISDVVTNSSSEVFSIYTDLHKDELLNLLKTVHKKHNTLTWEQYKKLPPEEKKHYDVESGMGGILEVKTFEDSYQEYLQYVPKNKKHLYTKEIHALGSELSVEELEKRVTIDIDEGFQGTINWILENLYVVGTSRPVVTNKEGRVIKLLDWDEESYVDENDNKI